MEPGDIMVNEPSLRPLEELTFYVRGYFFREALALGL